MADGRTADPGLAVTVDAPGKPEGGTAADALPEPDEKKEAEGGDVDAVASNAPEKPGAKEGEKAGDQDWFTPDLRRSTVSHDMTEDEARMFGSPDALSAAFTLMDRKIADLGREPKGETEPEGQEPPERQPPAERPAAAAPPAEADLGIDLDSEEFHPAVVGTFKKMAGKISAMERDLATAIGESKALRAHFLEQETQAFENRLEGYFAGMGQVYEPVLGKGTGIEIKGTPQYDKRVAIVEQMHLLQSGHIRLGRPVPDERELFDRASRIVLGKEMAAAARRQLAGKVQAREAGMITRPTHRKAAPTGTESAEEEKQRVEAIVTARARELGLMAD